MAQDSTGKPVVIGDRVRFRGKVFTIAGIGPTLGRLDTHVIEFLEPIDHTEEVPDELSIDKIGGTDAQL